MPSQSYKRNTNRKCPYADSCFECPLPDCKISQCEAPMTNNTPYELQYKESTLKVYARRKKYKADKKTKSM